MAKSSAQLFNKLSEIDGIGPVVARKLIKAGIRAPRDILKAPFRPMVSDEAAMMVEFRPAKRISWKYAHDFLQLIKKGQGVGSYRQHKATLGDIDILTTAPMAEVVNEIKALSPMVKVLGEYSSGPQRHSFVAEFKGKRARVDIFKTTIDEYPYALLHFTGPVEFNIRVRAHAKRKGLKLSQHGLSKADGGPIEANLGSEEAILAYLGVAYKAPEGR
jgi:DNA polymerase/3'-5' exonuclease PolX